MAVSPNLKQLVDQMPAPDRRGMFTEDMDQQRIESAIAALAQGGADNVLALVGMLGEPGAKENVKPHYALHSVVNYPLVKQDEAMRRTFCEAMASQVADEKLSDYNRAYLCQELQWAGRDEACPALGHALLHEALTDAAATALTAIASDQAASQLRAAAAKAKGKQRLNIIDALAALKDTKSSSVFHDALQDTDREVRIAAAVGLAEIADAKAVEPLLKAAEQAKGWERTQMTKACLVLAEQRAAAGHAGDAKRIYEHLQSKRPADTEAHVHEAARRGVAAVG